MKKKIFKKGSLTFCRDLKRGLWSVPATTWEHNYLLAYNFKKEAPDLLPSQRIIALVSLSCEVLFGNKASYSRRRERKHGSNKLCFVCKKHRATVQHHIILLKNGGFDNGINRIPICPGCHEQIHPWLRKDYVPPKKPVAKTVVLRRKEV